MSLPLRAVLALLVVGTSTVVFGGSPELDLGKAIELALSRNENAKIADLEVVVAASAVEKARVGFLPTLAATATGTARPYPTSLPRESGSGAVTLTQPILNPSAWPLYFQAEHQLAAQRDSSTDSKRLLAFDAADTFLSTLSVEQVYKAAQHRLDAAKADLADTQARVKAGLNSSNDVTRAEVSLASSEQEVANDKGSVDKAYLQLALLLSSPVEGPLTVPTGTLKKAAKQLADLDPLIAIAATHRPDLRAAQQNVEAAQWFATEPLLRIVPSFSVAGALTASSNPPGSAPWHDQTLGGVFSWTLYDASARYADKHARDALSEISILQLSLLRRSVTTDVRVAAAALNSSQAAFQVAAGAVASAGRNVEETATLYRQGLARAIELTDANDSRFAAEVGYASSEYSMVLAYLAVRQAAGLMPLGEDW